MLAWSIQSRHLIRRGRERFTEEPQGGNMLTLVLEAPLGPGHRKVGPIEYLRCEGEVLKTPAGETLAVHRGGMWRTEHDVYIAISIDSPTTILFDDPKTGGKAEFGPFVRMRIIDGSIWSTTDGQPVLLAHFDDMTQLWTIFPQPAFVAANMLIKAVEVTIAETKASQP
jgi:hypothetical protein